MNDELTQDFLAQKAKEDRDSQSCDLKKLSDMAEALLIAKENVVKLENSLSEAKAIVNRLSQEEIPQYMSQFGLTEIKLTSGEKVSYKEDLVPTITDQLAFEKFLEDRNESDIIKLNLKFNKMDPKKQIALKEYLMEQDFEFTSDNKVHYQTLAKYFRTVLGSGVDEEERADGTEAGVYITENDIKDFASIYKVYKTKIK